jgi:hypothetical protein
MAGQITAAGQAIIDAEIAQAKLDHVKARVLQAFLEATKQEGVDFAEVQIDIAFRVPVPLTHIVINFVPEPARG